MMFNVGGLCPPNSLPKGTSFLWKPYFLIIIPKIFCRGGQCSPADKLLIFPHISYKNKTGVTEVTPKKDSIFSLSAFLTETTVNEVDKSINSSSLVNTVSDYLNISTAYDTE